MIGGASVLGSTDFTVCGKNVLFCHSERSEFKIEHGSAMDSRHANVTAK